MAYKIYKQASAPILGVLFDMDGVILDTEKLYARFWAEACHAYGYPMTYEQALGMRSLNEQAGQAQLERYFGQGIDRAVIKNKRVELMDAYTDVYGVEPKPGIVELLDFLQSQGIRVAITTSSPHDRVRQYLQPLGLYDRFAHICTGPDVKHGKPSPEPYLMGLQRAGVNAHEAIVIENAPLGVEAGVAAGIFTIAVNTGPIKADTLYDAGADIVFDSMPHFAAHIDQLIETINTLEI